MRKLKFITIEANALLCPNPNEWFAKAYITETEVNNFRVLPGIKSKTKIATTLFETLLQESTCGWAATDSSLDAIDVDVCAVSAMAQICQFDLEKSFIALEMVKGSNADFAVASFMSHYWETMAKQIMQERELIRWQGDTDSVDPLLALCDGYLKGLLADATVIDVANTPSTVANVIAELTKIVLALPPQIQYRKEDLRLYIAPNMAMNYEIAAASTNTITNVTAALPLTFIGIKLVVSQGLPADTAVLTLKDNLIYAFDGENDGGDLKAVNMKDTTAEPLLRTRADLKMGFMHVNGAEIVLYS